MLCLERPEKAQFMDAIGRGGCPTIAPTPENLRRGAIQPWEGAEILPGWKPETTLQKGLRRLRGRLSENGLAEGHLDNA